MSPVDPAPGPHQKSASRDLLDGRLDRAQLGEFDRAYVLPAPSVPAENDGRHSKQMVCGRGFMWFVTITIPIERGM